jgi:hypothetical protein
MRRPRIRKERGNVTDSQRQLLPHRPFDGRHVVDT